MRTCQIFVSGIFVFTVIASMTLPATTALAQLRQWKLGGSGLQWDQTDSVNVLIDFDRAPGAIEPIFLRPDRTVFSLLENWQTWRDPSDKVLGYVDGQMPRIWKFKDGIPDPSENGSWLIDGDSTSYNIPVAQNGISAEYFTIDLAVPVPALEFGFFTSPVGFRIEGEPLKTDAVPAFDISVGVDADPAIPLGDNHLLQKVVANVGENLDPTINVDIPRQYVRFIRWRRLLSILDAEALGGCVGNECGGGQGNQTRAIRGNIGDFELYAQGIPQRAVYVGKIVDLGQNVNFGRLHWAATPMRLVDGVVVEDPDAQVGVQVEVRTGRDADPAVYHEFTNTALEKEVSRDRYVDLRPRLVRVSADAGSFRTREPKPGVRASISYDTENWTFWSVPFTESGQPLRLRSGSFLQMQLTLESRDFDAWVRLDSLWIETTPLLASDVLAEVARLDDQQPPRGFTEVELGQMTDFAIDVQAVFEDTRAPGFEAVRIRTGNRTSFRRLEMGDPLAVVEPAQIKEEADGLLVFLPQKITPSSNQPVRVVFGTEVFDIASTFEAEVFNPDDEGLPQPAIAGNASDEVSTNSLRILSGQESANVFVQDLNFSTPVLTPNGDGVHDQVVLSYALFRLPQPVPVSLEVHALNGRRLARIDLGTQDSGLQDITWDGRNENGSLLPPGLYLVSLSLETGFAASRQLRTLGIAY
jgi:hypothetical protein